VPAGGCIRTGITFNKRITKKEFLEMASDTKKKKPYLAALIFGIFSIGIYLLLFSNMGWVMENYTMGGWYAALPVGTALVFSFIHGAFASNVLESLGLTAKKH
jgi:hypothetical protein